MGVATAYRANFDTCMSVRYGHFPDADVCRDRGKDLSQGQGQNPTQIEFSGEVRTGPHAQESEGGPEEAAEGDQVNHGQRHRVRELGEDLFADYIRGCAETVPHRAENHDLQGLVEERFVRHVTGVSDTLSSVITRFF